MSDRGERSVTRCTWGLLSVVLVLVSAFAHGMRSLLEDEDSLVVKQAITLGLMQGTLVLKNPYLTINELLPVTYYCFAVSMLREYSALVDVQCKLDACIFN